MTVPGESSTKARGVVRLLNTSGGRVLNLAGDIDAGTVDSFLRRYGREPACIDVIDARSVTFLSARAVALVRNHLEAAGYAGRPVSLRLPGALLRLIDSAEGRSS